MYYELRIKLGRKVVFQKLEHWKTVLNGSICGRHLPLYWTVLIVILFIPGRDNILQD